MREEFVQLIIDRLNQNSDAIKADFAADKGVAAHFTAIDDLLPYDVARRVSDAFPPPSEMRLMDTFRERKHTSKSLDKFDPIISDITFAFQEKRVIERVAELTGISDAVGDPHLYAGGLSAMSRGHFLNPHIDNSHDGEQQNYRVLNLLYYITPDWDAANGGPFASVNRPIAGVAEFAEEAAAAGRPTRAAAETLSEPCGNQPRVQRRPRACRSPGASLT